MAGPPASLPIAPPRARTVLPVVAVVAVLALVVFGGYVTAGALSEPSGPPVDVGGVVRIRPLSGWELADRFAEPPGVRLTRGSGNLDVATVEFGGSRDELLQEYVVQVLEADAEQLSVSSIERLTLASGIEGSRIAYVGSFAGVSAPIEGEVTAVVASSGMGVVFDGWAPAGLLTFLLDDVRTMVGRAEVT
jgi:hypothetical protein